jgi:microcystin-dependent protein
MAKNNNFYSIGQAPIGSIVLFDFTPADGWWECDGSTKTAADYPELFGVISYTYGGSGADFDLPTEAGYVIRYI